ncbi:DUF5797 family protein [Halococcoides cellulosivorans]|uniref:Uncharacterized protein n=1 Tax=Halococcoides cellulosivorans TaxID=1679096 RepID=A0A2R4WZ33_9EURY|nr:DUF5797 family protein [Halococcoides cellulosivorans]AWB26786.1 hypothetical protein HARCEL1_03170 [Halococcoides cellulosivorans]
MSDDALDRIEDLVALEPTKNAELADRWELAGGSEVHATLEGDLSEYYYRDEDSMIRATAAARERLRDAGRLAESDERAVEVSAFEAAVIEALPGPDERTQSVVATLQAVREAGRDPSVDEVRSALHRLESRGLARRERRLVPTFGLAIDPATLEIEIREE